MRGAGLLLCLACAACATGGRQDERRGQFPTPEELAELPRQLPTVDPFAAEILDVEAWELAGPFPEAIEERPRDPAAPFEQLLGRAAAGRPGLVVLTESMHCAAREIGRFQLANRALPGESLRRFIGSRCGSAVLGIEVAFLQGEIPESATDQEVLQRWEGEAAQLVERAIGGRGRDAGLWFGREGTRATLVVAYGERRALLRPLAMRPAEGGRVEVRGELLDPAVRVGALFTRGAFGVGECSSPEEIALPRFAFTCQLDPQDEQAWVQVYALPPNRVLSTGVVDALLWPAGAPGSRYARRRYAEPREIADADAFEAAALDALNRVRADAKLPPLSLASEQSRTAREVAPAYFAAMLGQAPVIVADTVALGMIAGWNVEGVIQEGRFTSALVPKTRDLERWLSSVLEQPGPRQALLDPAAATLALGPVVGEQGQGLAALAATYTLFDEADHSANADRVFELIASKRAARSRAAPERLRDLDTDVARTAHAIQTRGEDPARAMRELLERAAQTSGTAVQGWTLEANRLEDLPFPEELLDRPSAELAIAVAHRREGKEAWGRFVVLIVSPSATARGA